MASASDNFFFIVWPYIAFFVFVIGAFYRYKKTGFKVTSLSSQFLEGPNSFWAVPFHWGLMVVLLGHLFAFLFPATTLTINSIPVRLIIIEVTAFIFGVTVVIGVCGLLWRRFTNDRILAVTTKMDVFIELLLLTQFILGCWIALGYRWGSSWFAADLSPYLWSLVYFKPNISAIAAMPVVIKLHIFGAFLLMFMIPFSRLIHFLVAPFHYISRPFQQVIWNWDRSNVRSARYPWSTHRPKNN